MAAQAHNPFSAQGPVASQRGAQGPQAPGLLAGAVQAQALAAGAGTSPGAALRTHLGASALVPLNVHAKASPPGSAPLALAALPSAQDSVPISSREYSEAYREVEAELKYGAMRSVEDPLPPQKLRAVLSEFLLRSGDGLAFPALASALANKASEDPALLNRIVREGTKAQKNTLAHAVLQDPRLGVQEKREVLGKLVQGRGSKGTADGPALEQVLGTASREALDGLASMMAPPGGLDLAKSIARQTSPKHQMLAFRAVLNNRALSAEQRTGAIRELLQNTSKQGFNALISGAGTPEERQALAGVIAGSVPLLERAGRELALQNQKTVASEILHLPVPKNTAGQALHLMMHPANMSPGNKNKLFDFFQGKRLLQPFAETQAYMPFHEGLLPGLSSKNVAALRNMFHHLASTMQDKPEVANPQNLGLTVSTADTSTHARTKGSSRTSTSSSTHTTGGSVTVKGGVHIPFLSKGEVSVTGSYSYQTGSSRSTTASRSTSESYGRTATSTLVKSAIDQYERDVVNWKTRNGFLRAANDTKHWMQQRPDAFQSRHDREYLRLKRID